MKTTRNAALFFAMIFVMGHLAHAQGGGVDCQESPEASTDVLMLVGAIGMVHGSRLLKHLAGRLRRAR